MDTGPDAVWQLKKQIAMLKAALRFYADEETYTKIKGGGTAIQRDMGQRARTALKE